LRGHRLGRHQIGVRFDRLAAGTPPGLSAVAPSSSRRHTHDNAPRLARSIIMLLEGALLLCRAGRTTEPMADAQAVAVAEVRRCSLEQS